MGAEQENTILQPQYDLNPVQKPIFSCSSKQEWILYMLYGLLVLFLLGLAIFLGITADGYAGLLIGVEVLLCLLIPLIFPRRLEVWRDSVKVCSIPRVLQVLTVVLDSFSMRIQTLYSVTFHCTGGYGRSL